MFLSCCFPLSRLLFSLLSALSSFLSRFARAIRRPPLSRSCENAGIVRRAGKLPKVAYVTSFTARSTSLRRTTRHLSFSFYRRARCEERDIFAARNANSVLELILAWACARGPERFVESSGRLSRPRRNSFIRFLISSDPNASLLFLFSLDQRAVVFYFWFLIFFSF